MIRGAKRFAILACAAVFTAALAVILVVLARSPAMSAGPASATSLPSHALESEGLRRADAGSGEVRSVADVEGSSARDPFPRPEARAPSAEVLPPDLECELEVAIVLRGSGLGVPGARVEVRTHRAEKGSPPHVDPSLSLGTAQADGRVVLLLPAGLQEVTAWSDTASGLISLDLVRGERRTAIVELDPVVVLLGRVVRAADGSPIEGARIWLDQPGQGTEVKSDDGGQFVFPRLPATGRGQVLQVRAVGYAPESVQVKAELDGSWTSQLPWLAGEGDLPPEAPGPEATPPIRRQRTSGMDRVSGMRSGNAPPALVADIAMEPGRALVGRIVDERGFPIQGAIVEATGHYAVRPGMAFPSRSASRSQVDGRFEVAGLRQDVTYQLECSAVGCATTRTVVPPSRVALDDRGSISLTAELALTGKVLDAEGLPVEDILVRATAYIGQPILDDAHREQWPRDPGYLASIEHVTHTDGLGVFDLSRLAVGSWKLTVESGDRAWVERTVDLQPGALADLEMLLPPDAPVLHGRLSQNGVATVGLRVLARVGNDRRTVTSDARGAFRFVGLRSATYSITASTWAPGASSWEEATLEAQVANPVPYELEMIVRKDR